MTPAIQPNPASMPAGPLTLSTPGAPAGFAALLGDVAVAAIDVATVAGDTGDVPVPPSSAEAGEPDATDAVPATGAPDVAIIPTVPLLPVPLLPVAVAPAVQSTSTSLVEMPVAHVPETYGQSDVSPRRRGSNSTVEAGLPPARAYEAVKTGTPLLQDVPPVGTIGSLPVNPAAPNPVPSEAADETALRQLSPARVGATMPVSQSEAHVTPAPVQVVSGATSTAPLLSAGLPVATMLPPSRDDFTSETGGVAEPGNAAPPAPPVQPSATIDPAATAPVTVAMQDVTRLLAGGVPGTAIITAPAFSRASVTVPATDERRASAPPVASDKDADAAIASDLTFAAPEPTQTAATPAFPRERGGDATAGIAAPVNGSVDLMVDAARHGQELDAVARDIVATGAGDAKLSFRLDPARLGPLTVELSRGDDGVSVRMETRDDGVRGVIADQQHRLVADARAAGVRIADTQVDFHRRDDSPPQASGVAAGGQGAGAQGGGHGGDQRAAAQQPQRGWANAPSRGESQAPQRRKAAGGDLYA